MSRDLFTLQKSMGISCLSLFTVALFPLFITACLIDLLCKVKQDQILSETKLSISDLFTDSEKKNLFTWNNQHIYNKIQMNPCWFLLVMSILQLIQYQISASICCFVLCWFVFSLCCNGKVQTMQKHTVFPLFSFRQFV